MTVEKHIGQDALQTGSHPVSMPASQDKRADALIARIEADTNTDLDRIRAAATGEAAEVIQKAHGRARHRVHSEIESLRRMRAEAIRHEEARLDTARRQLRQREAATVINAGLPEVAAALADLWADAGARQAWAHALTAAAASRARPGDWVIEHPKGWPAAERKQITAQASALSGATPVFKVKPEMTAGLRIHIGAVLLDASPEALMADPSAIGAALQAELARGGDSDDGNDRGDTTAAGDKAPKEVT